MVSKAKKSKNPLILVIHASTGSGHKIAAKAIEQSLKDIIKNQGLDNGFDKARVKTIDILEFCVRKIDGNNAVKAYSETLPGLFDIAWRNNFTGRILWGGGLLWPNILFKKFEKLLREHPPSAVVCTHMIGANIAAKARINLKMRYPIISVPTDYETEGLWPHIETDLFCVASSQMVETLEARRVPNQKILFSGIPVDAKFTKNYSSTKCRNQLNLPQDKTIAIILAGSNEANPYINLRKSLNHVIEYFALMDWMHFVFCVGNDEDYKKYLENKCKKHDAKNIEVWGFTDKMPQLMAAADIALGKSGGLSITECICSKLPTVLIGKAYAQERVNQRFMTQIGAAFRAVTYKDIVDALCHITSNKIVYQAILENMNAIRKPEASYTIAKAALQMAGCNNIEGYVEQAMQIYNKKKFFKPSIYIGKKPIHIR